MSLMNIQFRHVRCFIAVATEKSFARAATRLGVSQPALSQTILQLEETLGFAVFQRTTRNVSLTAYGETLLAKAKHLAQEMDGFHASIKSLQQSMHNELRVGYLIGTGVELLPGIAEEFERRRSQASLQFIEFDFHNPDAGLLGNSVDCGIIRPPTELSEDIRTVELFREKCVVCLAPDHPLAQREKVLLADILDEPIIAAPGNGIWRDYWLATQYRNGNPPRVVFETATVDAELRAVATRKGISITAESTAKYYARPGVVFRVIEDMEECAIAIGYRDSANALVADLIATAKDVAGRYLQTLDKRHPA
ncbi:LysR substrate-binding domain-containing protein [Dongia sp.]|uniref:LysR substrate-binding domain-containing protein n=1 Tax=Dongia sp. TaxID=1977262 RepID=UPI0035B0C8FB